jgi:hypothetical protein
MKKSALRPGISVVKLRAGFVALAIVLLGGLLILSMAMKKRLEEARLQREEMVASRVFDELEREVSAFLDGESARQHYGSLQETDPKSWAPFVVGYFKVTQADPQVVGADEEATRRVRWALAQSDGFRAQRGASNVSLPEVNEALGSQGDAEGGGPTPVNPVAERAPPALSPAGSPEDKAQSKQKAATKGSEIIQQLNRAAERRKAVPSSAAPKKSENEDQFRDYTEAY